MVDVFNCVGLRAPRKKYKSNELEKNHCTLMLYLLKHVGKLFPSRRIKQKLILFHKIQNDLSPPYFASLVPNNKGDVSRYNLRNVQHSQILHEISQLYFSSFLPSVIREKNAPSQATRELSSMYCFTNQLNYDIIPPQKLYFKGKRLAQIYHAKLRTGCSTLRLHLYSKT